MNYVVKIFKTFILPTNGERGGRGGGGGGVQKVPAVPSVSYRVKGYFA